MAEKRKVFFMGWICKARTCWCCARGLGERTCLSLVYTGKRFPSPLLSWLVLPRYFYIHLIYLLQILLSLILHSFTLNLIDIYIYIFDLQGKNLIDIIIVMPKLSSCETSILLGANWFRSYGDSKVRFGASRIWSGGWSRQEEEIGLHIGKSNRQSSTFHEYHISTEKRGRPSWVSRSLFFVVMQMRPHTLLRKQIYIFSIAIRLD